MASAQRGNGRLVGRGTDISSFYDVSFIPKK